MCVKRIFFSIEKNFPLSFHQIATTTPLRGTYEKVIIDVSSRARLIRFITKSSSTTVRILR
jgi:hypothetical protein